MAVALPFYNLFVGLGVGLATVLFHARLRVYFATERERDRALLLLVVALPAAAVGAWGFDRVAGAASGPVLPLRGLAFYGGLLAALVAVAALAPVLGLPMRRLFDAGAPPIALGHAVGRIGCGVAGCCYGRRVDPHGALHAIGLARVPTQWLESAALGAIALWLARTRPAREGAVIARYFASYAVVRIALETLRDDPRGALPWLPAWLSPSQWVSVGLLVAAGALTATRARAAA